MPFVAAAPFRGLAGKSDKRLVEYAQRGDTHAIEVLYDRYATAILRYCRSLLRSTQEAEDVQQEVFVTALSALRNGAGPDTFRPWLYRVAHNACISHMRAKRPTLAAVDGELVASATTEPASEEREELRQLLDDLSALPAVQRGALLLREMDGFSYEQVGQVLGLPVTTVRSTIFRARSTLQGLAEARDARCEEIQAELSELADRRGRRSRRITSHLNVCTECRDFRAGLRNRPTVLRGYVPALPIGVLATIKATALGAKGTAGGATAGAAAAGGASGGMGVLGGAGGGKLVAAAASACALIGGAGTQVGILGGAGEAVDKPASIAAGASPTARTGDGGKASGAGTGALATHRHAAAATTRSSFVPGSAGAGAGYHAPGTVVWRPAGEDSSRGGAILSSDGHGHGVARGGSTVIARTGSAPASMAHWGHARPGTVGGDDEPDDNSDDGPFAPPPGLTSAPASGGDDDRSSDRGDRRGSTTASATGSHTSGYDTSRERETDAAGDRSPGTSSDAQPPTHEEPAGDPAAGGEQSTSTTGETPPPSDPPPDSTSSSAPDTSKGGSTTTTPPPSDTTQSGSTTTTRTDPPPSGTTTTGTTPSDPAPPQDPPPATP